MSEKVYSVLSIETESQIHKCVRHCSQVPGSCLSHLLTTSLPLNTQWVPTDTSLPQECCASAFPGWFSSAAMPPPQRSHQWSPLSLTMLFIPHPLFFSTPTNRRFLKVGVECFFSCCWSKMSWQKQTIGERVLLGSWRLQLQGVK